MVELVVPVHLRAEAANVPSTSKGSNLSECQYEIVEHLRDKDDVPASPRGALLKVSVDNQLRSVELVLLEELQARR